MQIRLGNRQDEPIIRTIVAQAMEEFKAGFDLNGRDCDLNNIEANYFWHDGIFVVAEEDGQIIGLSGARRGGSEQEIELLRMVVIPSRRRRGLARSLLSTILFFAADLEYESMVVAASGNCHEPALTRLGFRLLKSQGDCKIYSHEVSPLKDRVAGRSS